MPLGGQHICAALLKLRDYHLKQGCKEAQLHASLRYIKATTYMSNTPVAVCRRIAGRHQATQHDDKESSIAESLSFLMTMAEEKRKARGTATMTDGELFCVLDNMGMVRGSDKSLAETGELGIKKATAITKQQVCFIRGHPRIP